MQFAPGAVMDGVEHPQGKGNSRRGNPGSSRGKGKGKGNGGKGGRGGGVEQEAQHIIDKKNWVEKMLILIGKGTELTVELQGVPFTNELITSIKSHAETLTEARSRLNGMTSPEDIEKELGLAKQKVEA
jgi:hypothetical protein